MSEPTSKSFQMEKSNSLEKKPSEIDDSQRKGPVSFLSGAMTSILFAWLCFGLSNQVVTYFTLHSPHYSSPIAQSVASGFKTLVIGITFLATFTFAFIGLGLTLVFIRSLFDGRGVNEP